MLINFFEKTMNEINYQINIADLQGDIHLSSNLTILKNTLVKETESLANNSEFILGFKNNIGRIETISDEGFTITEIENIAFIQPLEILTEHHMNLLEEAIENNSKWLENKRVIIVPYTIKSMTATLMTKPK